MHKYRISKYNPLFRSGNGRYLIDDWISISDIGKTFNGNQLTIESYKSIEDCYIIAIQLIMNQIKIPYLTIKNVNKNFSDEIMQDLMEKYNELYTEDIIETYLHVKEMDNLEISTIDLYCRLLLRENIWSEMFYQKNMQVFIKYDYLMGIHTSRSLEKIIPQIESLGLFVEKF